MQTHILIVDDEDTIRRMMALLLQIKGYTTSEAASGQAALELAQQTPFDLVITDLFMPGMNGMELAQKLIEQDPSRPVIMISARGDIDYARQAIDLGIADYITKPFDLTDVFERIDQALERRRSGIVGQAPSL